MKRIDYATNINQKRMLSETEARAYTGLGRTSLRNLGGEIGCIHHYGRRILYDRYAIDAFFDNGDKVPRGGRK